LYKLEVYSIEGVDNVSDTFYSKLGIFIIIVGALGSIGIISAFDWETWNDIKEYPSIYEEEIAILKIQLTNMWTTAVTAFLGSLVLGATLMALGKIVEQQADSNEYLKMIYRIEKKDNRAELDKQTLKKTDADLEQYGSQRINY